MRSDEAAKIIEKEKRCVLTDCERPECKNCGLVMDTGEILEALDMAISALKKQEQGRWNPVSKDLPKKNGDYLVTCEVCGERYVEESFFCRCDDGDVFWTSQNVIAWQPRIEPYTAEEENHEM